MNGEQSASDIEKVGDTLSSSSHSTVKPQIDGPKPYSNTTTSQDRETKPLSSEEQYFLPKPDGDQWEILFRPKLEADTLRCNAWKDEVQNLLIFAGLFSAVVTAFIVESYKFLQPDPNDAIIGLLFHISNSLNNTAVFPPSVNPQAITTPFWQTPSSIRINVFWIISLIFSLATVLIGTIALQWLREHQSYSGYTNQEKLAIFHMRSAALKAWHLPQVFAMLPLLLQTALVLFLAGLIDFSSRLGSKLTVPVSIVIGLTLLFLIATTILPSLQVLSFFCGLYPRATLPNPCPYKSPQSHALRTLVGLVLRATLLPLFPLPDLRFAHNIWFWKWINQVPPPLLPDHLATSVYSLFDQGTWLTSDQKWLSLRDACHQRMLDKDPHLYDHRSIWEDSFPLSDATESLIETVNQTPAAQHTESFLIALVHCFHELSASIWTVPLSSSRSQRMDRRNNYFEKLHWKPSCSMSTFFLHDGNYKFDRFPAFGSVKSQLNDYLAPNKRRLFCDDQTVVFISMLRKKYRLPILAEQQLELWSRTLQSSTKIKTFTSTFSPDQESNLSIPAPTIMDLDTVHFNIPVGPVDRRFSAAANVLSAVLNSAAHLQSIHAPCAHPQMVNVIFSVARLTNDYLESYKTDANALQYVDKQFVTIFRHIADYLITKWPKSSSSSSSKLDIFFYLSSVFVWGLLYKGAARVTLMDEDSHFGQALRSLVDALHNAWTSGQKDELIEKRFRLEKGSPDRRFRNGLWDQLFELHAIGQAPASTDGKPLVFRVGVLLREDGAAENTTTIVTNSLPFPTSPGIDDDSSNTSMGEDNIPHPLSYPPATIHPATTTEIPTSLDDARSRSQFLSDGLLGTLPLRHESIGAEAVPSINSHSLLSSTLEHLASVSPQPPTVNGLNHYNGQNLQIGEFATDMNVAPPTVVALVGPVEVSGCGHQEQLRTGCVSIDIEDPN